MAWQLSWVALAAALSNVIGFAKANYAPYAYVKVSDCIQIQSNASHTQWLCTGHSNPNNPGFAANTRGTYDPETNMCDTYCLTSFYTSWTFTVNKLPDGAVPKYTIGGELDTLPPEECVPVERPFKCYEKLKAVAPMNTLSISIHAAPDTKEYYFSEADDATCSGSVQCSAFRILKTSLLGNNKEFPTFEDVSAVRGTEYSCILSYIGAGSVSGAERCYEQLGPICYRPANLTQLCITNEDVDYGITNAGLAVYSPLVLCAVSNDAPDRPARYSFDENSVPYGFSACGGIVQEPDFPVVMTPTEVTISYNLALSAGFKSLSSEIILSVPVTCEAAANARIIEDVARLMTAVAVSAGATGIQIDLSDATDDVKCSADNVVALVVAFKRFLTRVNVDNVLLKMPVNQDVMDVFPASRLNKRVAVFVVPGDKLGPRSLATATSFTCQTPMRDEGPSKEASGEMKLLDYVLQFKSVLPPGSLMVSFGMEGSVLDGVDKDPTLLGGAIKKGQLLMADSEGFDLQCDTRVNGICCLGNDSVVVNGIIKPVTAAYIKRADMEGGVATIYNTFGINQFMITYADSDYMLGRESLPVVQTIVNRVKKMYASAGTGELASYRAYRHARPDGVVVFVVNETAASERFLGDAGTEPYARNASRQKRDMAAYISDDGALQTSLAPKYRLGTQGGVKCPGMIANSGILLVTNVPYKEFYKSNYFESVYVADYTKIRSCSVGEPKKKLRRTDTVPLNGIDVNTFLRSDKRPITWWERP